MDVQSVAKELTVAAINQGIISFPEFQASQDEITILSQNEKKALAISHFYRDIEAAISD